MHPRPNTHHNNDQNKGWRRSSLHPCGILAASWLLRLYASRCSRALLFDAQKKKTKKKEIATHSPTTLIRHIVRAQIFRRVLAEAMRANAPPRPTLWATYTVSISAAMNGSKSRWEQRCQSLGLSDLVDAFTFTGTLNVDKSHWNFCYFVFIHMQVGGALVTALTFSNKQAHGACM